MESYSWLMQADTTPPLLPDSKTKQAAASLPGVLQEHDQATEEVRQLFGPECTTVGNALVNFALPAASPHTLGRNLANSAIRATSQQTWVGSHVSVVRRTRFRTSVGRTRASLVTTTVVLVNTKCTVVIVRTL